MNKSSLLDEKHIVNAIVRVGGQKVNIVSLRIEQEYGQHHYFELQLDYDITGKTFMVNPTNHIDLIGKLVVIDLQHGNENSKAYIFRGVITKVKMTGKDGKHGYLVLEGASPTIMLERGKRLDVYSDMTLYSIFKELIDGVYSDYMKFVNNPTYENKIDFLMQYSETDWEFLQRIAYLYGENLFYSGSEILFGAYKEWEAIKLTYDKEISDIEFCSRMLPNQSVRYQYQSEQDSILEKQSPDKIENSNTYLDAVSNKNTALTKDKPAKDIIGASVSSQPELDELVKREKVRTAAQTIYITGKAKTYHPSVGRIITVYMPETMDGKKELGTYRVTKSIHTIDENHRYVNEFEAVPASLQTMPVREPKLPIAESVLGTVTSHEDPRGQGRVQVDFSFANQYSRIWMRVMTPNAGSSAEVGTNRGMVFVPEKGDQVMVGFEHGDPNRPYVMGSMFHGGNTEGGKENNHIKSIITRSGIKIVFNDDQKSLHIEDPSGNTWDMDGNGNIAVNAPKNLTIKAGENIDITAGKDMTTSVGGNNLLNIGKDSHTMIENDSTLTINGNYSTSIVGDMLEHIQGNLSSTSEKDRNDMGMGQINSFGENEVSYNSQKDVNINSAEATKNF